jgi:hypothetical protein
MKALIRSLMIMIVLSPALAMATGNGRLMVALENGGVVQLDASNGTLLNKYATGPNSFGVVYSHDGRRAFATDKNDGTLLEIDTKSDNIIAKIMVGNSPQQPAITSSGRIFVPLSGEAAVAVVDSSSSLRLETKISTGAETKPHIVSLSPDQKTLWVTVQGKDPRVVAIDANTRNIVKEFRYDLVPRVVFGLNTSAIYTAHHSTGLHQADLATGASSTVLMDSFGNASEARKQIEGIAVSSNGQVMAYTHEGKKSLVVAKQNRKCNFAPLANKPYWVTLNERQTIAFVSIPDAGLVEAYDLRVCWKKPIWSANVGGKAKRMAISE